MSTLPARYTFELRTGDQTDRVVKYRVQGLPVNLTGYTIQWQFIAGATVTATVASGQLTLDALQGQISLSLTGAVTATLNTRGTHVLKITAPIVKTLLVGEVILNV